MLSYELSSDPRKSAKRNGALNFGLFMDSNVSR
jgi:hypothetical protein